MKFKYRPFISICTTFLFFAALFTGIFMYIMPDPSMAYWNKWSFLGLEKLDWESLHGLVSIYWSLFLVLHLILNWKPFVSYLKRKKNKVSGEFEGGKELLAAVAVCLAVIVGSAVESPLKLAVLPFEALQTVWYEDSHEPPVEDLQAIPVKYVVKLYDLGVGDVKRELKSLGVDMNNDELSLEEYGEMYEPSPRDMFNAMTK